MTLEEVRNLLPSLIYIRVKYAAKLVHTRHGPELLSPLIRSQFQVKPAILLISRYHSGFLDNVGTYFYCWQNYLPILG